MIGNLGKGFMTHTKLRIATETGKAMPRKIGFTLKTLASLSCPAGKPRIYVYDSNTPHLAYCLTALGSRSFLWAGRVQRRATRFRLGGSEMTVEQARRRVAEISANVLDGLNPQREKREAAQAEKIKNLWERYRDDHLKLNGRPSTLLTDESRWNTCMSKIEGRRTNDLTSDDVQTLHRKLSADRGRTTANRAVQLLRRVFNFNRVRPNPAAAVDIDLNREAARERYLLPDEMRRLLAGLVGMSNATIADAIRVALFTGARKANVLSMAWADLNLADAVWTIPATAFKTGRSTTVHLSPPAVSILTRRRGCDPIYVFPGRDSGHLTEPKFAWTQLLKSAKISDFHFHDLRHSLASYAAAAGGSLPLIGRQLGHRDSKTTARYSHVDLRPVRIVIDAAANAMLAAGNVESK
mgnify:CR=1 FL=1